MTEGRNENPEELEQADPIQGPIQDLDGYRRGFKSILFWGGFPQALGVLLTLVWESGVRNPKDASLSIPLLTVPLFAAGVLSALIRFVFAEYRERNPQRLKGAWHGLALFVIIWILTSTMSCGWVIFRIGKYIELP